jgi:L-2,4-diaminobutyric acid acetyltransferase
VKEKGQEGTGVVHKLSKGSFYQLDGHEKHYLRATKGDLHCICTFNPPVAGTEDHSEEGFYPAVDDNGVAYHSVGSDDMNKLFQPPVTFPREGSRKVPAPRIEEHARGDRRYRTRTPTMEDGAAIHKLVLESGLDVNSPYAYLAFCRDFADTCVIAEEYHEGTGAWKLLGFVQGYAPPSRPDTLFVWQVATAAAAQGLGLASSMILNLARWNDSRFVEATVTPSNAASLALFRGLGPKTGSPVEETAAVFREDHFPAGATHEQEDVLRIGPFRLQ